MTHRSIFFVVMTTGFALFSMFFGSGNLVFPVQVGSESGGQIAPAMLGLLLTGVVVPVVGALAMMLFQGDYKRYFSAMGCRAELWFPLLALSLMGPFGVLPRCLTVAEASFGAVFPSVPSTLFVSVACGLIFAIGGYRHRIVPFLGTVLTPVLRLSWYPLPK